MKRLRVLLVEDSEDDTLLLEWELRRGGYDPVSMRVDTGEAMREALPLGWDVIISDYSLPQFSGLAALEVVQSLGLDIPFIIVSGNIGEDVAVATMKTGAHDYVMKRSLSRLVPAIERELREAAVRNARRAAERELRENEARLRAIVSHVPGAVFQLVRDRSGNFRFPYVSEGSRALLGLTLADLQGSARQFFGLIAADDRETLRFALDESARELRAAGCEVHVRTAPDRAAKWVGLRFSPRSLDDGSVVWDGIMTDITQSKNAALEIKRSRERLSELSSHLEKVKEQERTHIAREIHDNIGGNLTAIKIDLLWLAARLAKGRKDVRQKLNAIETLLDQTMETTSRIGRDLRPGILDLGLLAAIEWQAEEFAKRMEIPCSVVCDDDEPSLVPELASTLFAIFRETLTNISKHARATEVRVNLRFTPDLVDLTVTDDGCGISAHDMWKAGSFGLRGMQERAAQLGGVVSVYGVLGQGTTVSVRLPHGAAVETARHPQTAVAEHT